MPTREEFETLKRELQELKDFVNSFLDNGTMPLALGEAIKARLAQGLTITSAPIPVKTVNESGSGSYDVAKKYDGMYIDESGRLIGYYNS